MHSMKTIRSHNHKKKSYETTKSSLSGYDYKRYNLEDGKTSLAYEHKIPGDLKTFKILMVL